MMVMPPCVQNHHDAKKWLANSVEWMQIECLVFAFYTATLLILMFKSRFSTIGMDQSGQFEPFYIQKMMNEIISNIPFRSYRNKTKFVKHWQNNEEFVDVIGTQIRIKMSAQDCEEVYDKWYLNEMPFVTQE